MESESRGQNATYVTWKCDVSLYEEINSIWPKERIVTSGLEWTFSQKEGLKIYYQRQEWFWVNCKLKNTIHSVLKKYIWNEKFCYSLSSCCSLRSKTSVKFCSVSKKLSVRSGNRNGPPTTRNVLSKDTCNTTQNQHQVTICLQDTNKLIRWKFLKFIGFRLVVILLIKFIRIRKRQVGFLTVYHSLASQL